MKITLLDAATLGYDMDFDKLGRFGELDVYQTTPSDKIEERISNSDIVIVNKVRLDGAVLKNARRVRLICEAATGYDNIDIEWCAAHGIAVSNVVGYSSDSVAQITVATVLSLVSHLNEYSNFVSDGSYSRSGVATRISPTYHEISGAVWGIVGYGNIGRRVAEVAKALGCQVIVCKNTPVEGIECVDINELCKRSDIITLHTPLNDSTRGLIGREQIGLMKKTAIVVNESRGAVVDEEALAEAVKDGRIAGLGSDVYSVEPFSESHPYYEIKDRENVCFTPHMAWGAYEARERCLNEISKNILAFINGNRRNRVEL
ncbi:MAG: NAD(P)-dependent oxidoreductase [Clostridia bacterium]|nr:NAD(P)-dependent oxidoreductase [Clostridia bacterium]